MPGVEEREHLDTATDEEDAAGTALRRCPAWALRHVGIWLLGVLTLAVVNFVAGRLGLLLAIPPGFVTAVFPPSGIGLAALLVWGGRLWPGIALGSFAFNLHLSLAGSVDTTWLDVAPVAASIAAGSTLQALVAARLLRRSTRNPTLLVLERDVLALLLIGGPACCLVAATWGTATLSLGGILAEGTLLYTAFTWWVGDTIGVLIFTPIVLALCATPRAVWRPRLLSVALPLCTAFGLVVLVYEVVGERENEAIAASFQRRVETLNRDLYHDLRVHAEALWSIRSFFAGSEEVGRDEFVVFVRRALSAYPGLLALSWNPRVHAEERDAFEARIARELDESFEIREHDEAGRLVRAADRSEYVVVQYIEPFTGNQAALGFDVSSEPIRRTALERARDTGEPAATQRIRLLQNPGSESGFLLFLPIYESDTSPPTLAARDASLRGYAVAVLRVDALLEAAFEGLDTDGVVLNLRDEWAPPAERLLGRYPTGPGAAEPAPLAARYAVVAHHHVGGRSWAAHFFPTVDYLAAQPTWQAWLVLAGGLTFTGLLGAFLLVITGRAVLEAERLNEIAEVNHRLELTNEELARFAYAASHDLRSPLRGVGQLVELTLADHGEALPAEARDHLEMIHTRVHRMAKLLDDLLEYSRVGWLKDEPEAVDTTELVGEIVALTPESERFEFALDDMPVLRTSRVPLAQVLRNLVANAIKHHDRDRGRIEIACEEEDDHYVFAVRDDGPGIPPEDEARVFEMFQTLQPRDGGHGSGMGLALVRKIVTNRGGEVWLESDGGRGATIRFRWPKTPKEHAERA